MTAYLLLAVVAVLQVADIYTTHVIITRGGSELNKFMRFFINRLGLLPGLIVPKLAMLAMMAGGIAWFKWVARTFPGHWAAMFAELAEYLILYGAAVTYGAVVWHNALEMRK